jgi:RNA ligase (TIGR02306 family)
MKLATFETITELLPIEGADRIELARVQGWQSVVKKGDFKVGDKVIFIPIDTVIEPSDWNKFLWDKKDPSKHIRVKTARLMGAVSQGLIFPHSLAPDVPEEDLPSHLHISKYEKPIPAHLAGQVAGDFPKHILSKTDEDNLKSNVEVLEELKKCLTVVSTVKLDGTSATYIKELDGSFKVCSRNLELKDTESNVHWQMARKYKLAENMILGTAIQGEICGPGIQGNPMGLDEIKLFVFNYKDLDTGKYYNRIPEAIKLDVPEVPTDAFWNQEAFNLMSIDHLQSWTNKVFYENNTPAEGLVFRGLIGWDDELTYSKTLQKMLSVKIINQNYKD